MDESRAEACSFRALETTLSTALDRRCLDRCSLSRSLERLRAIARRRRSRYSSRPGESVYEKYSAEGTHLARAREIRRRVVRETRHPATRESTCERTMRERAADPSSSPVHACVKQRVRIGIYPRRLSRRRLQSVSVTPREFPRFVERA